MGAVQIALIEGDITRQRVDTIVNAANSSLMGGGGVDGAIHRAGGPAILEDCKRIVAEHGECAIGEAVITTGGNLPAKFVIHTVGPIWHGGNRGEAELLASCYQNSLRLASEHGCKTIAFPNISTGIYGYPKKEASVVALTALKPWLVKPGSLSKIRFVCFDHENYRLYLDQADQLGILLNTMNPGIGCLT